MQPVATEPNFPIICCDQANIEGDVKFGEGCILHPGCDIRAYGPIIFGDFNIVEEKVKIYNNDPKATMLIGSYNYFEIGCYVLNSTLGNCNDIQINSHLSKCSIKDKCIVTTCSIVPEGSALDSSIVVVENGKMRKNYQFNEEVFKKNLACTIIISAIRRIVKYTA